MGNGPAKSNLGSPVRPSSQRAENAIPQAKGPESKVADGKVDKQSNTVKESKVAEGKADKQNMAAKGTFANQASIPHLPIPPLEKTCETFLEMTAPLLNAEEYKKTCEAIEDFRKNLGPKMQDELIKYAKDKDNYVDAFWDDAYLLYDDPVTINVNPFFVLEDDPTPERNNQIDRAARLVFSILKFHRAVRSETLEPDMVGSAPLCMSQFKKVLGSARIPGGRGQGSDLIVTKQDSKHIIVLCRNQFYMLEVVLPDGSLLMSIEEIAAALEGIKQDADELDDASCAQLGVGVLTSDYRTCWAKNRRALEAVGSNKAILGAIDDALFVLCLDECSPQNLGESSANALRGTSVISDGVETGTCMSRWYDKLSIIVAENGSAAVNFEHTPADGHSVLRMVSEVVTDTIIKYAQTISGKAVSNHLKSVRMTAEQLSTIKPRKMEFELNDKLREAIRECHAKLVKDLIKAYPITSLEYTSYGSALIKQNKMSPDAFVQQAMIAAVHKATGETCCVYESVMTKRFLMGRTEAGRSLTAAAKKHSDLVNVENAAPAIRVPALREACSAHSKMTSLCGMGMGVDRHLYALKCAWKRKSGELPALYSSPGYAKLSVTILSTSNCGNPSLKLFGFGPVSPTGVGIGYIIKERGVSFSICSRAMDVDAISQALVQYLNETKQALKTESKRLSFKPSSLVQKFSSK